jgi:hypothetical protein
MSAVPLFHQVCHWRSGRSGLESLRLSDNPGRHETAIAPAHHARAAGSATLMAILSTPVITVLIVPPPQSLEICAGNLFRIRMSRVIRTQDGVSREAKVAIDNLMAA